MRETNEVEKSISSIAMLPSFVSNHFEKGSVVKMRKPRDVALNSQARSGRAGR
jgi:hypothetical protein